MKILAIDFGEKNFGIALTDDLGIIAIPYSVEKNDNNFHKTLIKIINEKKINKIIAGFPLSLKGQEGEQALRVRKYFEELSKKINMNIELVDERFSTRISENKLRELKKNTEKDIDKFAAAIILENYLSKSCK
jgi:putative Holliday junction resolvase